MKHFVIGTAGHVDHGKTMLVKALTGKDTDRLKEEKQRGISIELGFAPFQLPSGIMAGVVDVPGHERFIKQMLAGVSGIDLVLLVIAADEGVMPQTKEHLEIIDLLNIQNGIIVISKIDLVDAEWLDMIKADIKEAVKGTVLEKAPMVAVSAVQKTGLKELIQVIDDKAKELTEKPTIGNPRLPIDRVFSVTGFGTVVTGTLVGGTLVLGEEVEILPKGLSGRIRGLQNHGQKVDVAEAGQRVAVNLSGVEREMIDRGSVLTVKRGLQPSHRIDVKFNLLSSAEKSLLNRARIRIHIGTAEILARIVLLESDEMEPGQSSYAQLECEEPIVAAKGDLFVARSYSPMRTIGGGKVVDAAPTKHKRLNDEVLEQLRTKEKGSPEELMEQILERTMLLHSEQLIKEASLGHIEGQQSLENLEQNGSVKKILIDNKPYYMATMVFSGKAKELEQKLREYHQKYPLRQGLSKELIRNQVFLGLNNKSFSVLLNSYQEIGLVMVHGEYVSLHDFTPTPSEKLKPALDAIEQKYKDALFQPPDWNELIQIDTIPKAEAEEVLNYFLQNGALIKLEDGILMHKNSIEIAKAKVMDYIKQHGEITLAEIRDLLQTSRKFALPVVNWLDQQKLTRRVEDKRILY